MLPYKPHTVITPTATPYTGVQFERSLCGVSVIRSGESMEKALRTCCAGIDIGKILIHRRHHSGGVPARGTALKPTSQCVTASVLMHSAIYPVTSPPHCHNPCTPFTPFTPSPQPFKGERPHRRGPGV